MREFTRSVLAGVITSLVLVGCSGSEVPDSVVSPQNGAPTASKSAPAQANSTPDAKVPAAIAKLFSRMDSVGKGSPAAYDEALTEFRNSASPIGTLAKFYAELPKTALGARWKTVYAAGQISTSESVEFLDGVAAGAPEKDSSLEGDIGFRMRYTAAVGVVTHFAAGIPGAEASVEHLLKDADPSIAQLVGVELFSMGRLTDAWRAILEKRGISNKFRQMTDAELAAVRTVDPSKDGHAGPDTRTRPRFTSVPAFQEAE